MTNDEIWAETTELADRWSTLCAKIGELGIDDDWTIRSPVGSQLALVIVDVRGLLQERQ